MYLFWIHTIWRCWTTKWELTGTSEHFFCFKFQSMTEMIDEEIFIVCLMNSSSVFRLVLNRVTYERMRLFHRCRLILFKIWIKKYFKHENDLWDF
jgi:hypothetical protein